MSSWRRRSLFCKTGVLNVDLFGIERNGGKLIAPLGSEPFDVAAGDDLTVSVVIQNKGIGHTLVPEQRDFYECWVEFQAKDAAGHTLMHSGAVGPDGSLDPTRAQLYQSTDQRARHAERSAPGVGHARDRLQQHHRVGPLADCALSIQVAGRRDGADHDHREGQLPALQPALHRLWHGQALRDADGGDGLAHADAGAWLESCAPPDPADNPEWMRWNNYGIGLLDAQQYAESARAFEHVAQLRPDYADAYTNMAIADFSWQRYERVARPILKRRCSLLRTMLARFTTWRWWIAFRAIPMPPSPICSK